MLKWSFKIWTFNSMEGKEVKPASFYFTLFFAFFFRMLKSVLLTQLTRDRRVYCFPWFMERMEVTDYYFYLILFVFLFSLHTEQTKHLQTTEMWNRHRLDFHFCALRNGVIWLQEKILINKRSITRRNLFYKYDHFSSWTYFI